MTIKTIQADKEVIPNNRRFRRFGLNDSILSTNIVYLNPYNEDHSDPDIEEVAMFAAVTKSFNE